jgi:hypothetical protein
MQHNREVEVKTRLTIDDSRFLWVTVDCDGLRDVPMKWGFLTLSACTAYATVASRMCARCVHEIGCVLLLASACNVASKGREPSSRPSRPNDNSEAALCASCRPLAVHQPSN